MSQLKKGALLSYSNILLTNIIGLVLTPYIIRKLGDSEYGLFTLIGSFVGYLALMNLGINNAVIRFVAKYKAQNDREGEKIFLSTTMWVYFCISFVLVCLGMVAYFNFENIFSDSLTSEEMVKGKIMFLLFVFNLSFTIPGGSFQGICEGYERFIFPRLLSIVRYVLRSVTIFAVLMYGGKAISIVVVDTIFSFLAILITALYVFKNIGIKVSLYGFDKSMVKEIFAYSLWVFLFGIVYKFQWNAGQVVLGINTDTVTVAIYGVGILLGSYYGAFSGGINSVLIPRATQMVVKRSDGLTLTKAMIKVGRLNTFILFFILSGFILFGKAFIFLWVGETYLLSWYIAIMIMLVMTMPLIQAFGNSILEARKKNRYKSILSIVTVGTAVIIGFFLSKDYGIFGIAIPLISAMGINSIIMNFYYKKIFDFKILFFFSKAVIIPFGIFLVLTTVTYFLLKYVEIQNWFTLLLGIVIYTFISLTAVFFIAMNDYEKNLIAGILNFRKKR